MKKLFTSLMLVSVLILSLNAAVLTVSNDPNAPAEYSTMTSALDVANPGDTIMVYGSTVSYGSITINREVVLIGSGYHNPYGNNSTLGTVSLNGTGAFSPSNTKISGFIIGSLNFNGTSTSSKTIEGVLVERCQLGYVNFDDSDVLYRNDTIRNCLLRGSYVYFVGTTPGYDNVSFHNNVFDNEYFYSSSSTTSLQGVMASSNVFLNRISNYVFYNSYRLTLEDNIFYAAEPTGCRECAFNNNLTFANTDNDLDGNDNPGNPSSVAGGTLIGVNPLFVSYPLGGGAFSYSHDLTVTAPTALTGATDGGIIGIHGGLMPFDPGANPSIPQMTEVSFPANASSVKIDGTLNVTFKAKKQD